MIHRDMEKFELYHVKKQILEGYRDASQGKYLKSSGDFIKDFQELENKEKNGW